MMQKLRMFFMGQNSGVLASQRMVHGTECTGKGTPGNSAGGFLIFTRADLQRLRQDLAFL
ncbi:MAG TPA: hypothetical protein DEP62_02920 [Flavobacteriales bacterium]|nr:hypothetical protein [Flavobacteriales bacterium]